MAGRLLLRLNAVDLLGVLAGVHTQPAVLAYANRLTERRTSLAYASVHPLATILKILIARSSSPGSREKGTFSFRNGEKRNVPFSHRSFQLSSIFRV